MPKLNSKCASSPLYSLHSWDSYSSQQLQQGKSQFIVYQQLSIMSSWDGKQLFPPPVARICPDGSPSLLWLEDPYPCPDDIIRAPGTIKDFPSSPLAYHVLFRIKNLQTHQKYPINNYNLNSKLLSYISSNGCHQANPPGGQRSHRKEGRCRFHSVHWFPQGPQQA